jgi:hypothetical protein
MRAKRKGLQPTQRHGGSDRQRDWPANSPPSGRTSTGCHRGQRWRTRASQSPFRPHLHAKRHGAHPRVRARRTRRQRRLPGSGSSLYLPRTTQRPSRWVARLASSARATRRRLPPRGEAPRRRVPARRSPRSHAAPRTRNARGSALRQPERRGRGGPGSSCEDPRRRVLQQRTHVQSPRCSGRMHASDAPTAALLPSRESDTVSRCASSARGAPDRGLLTRMWRVSR